MRRSGLVTRSVVVAVVVLLAGCGSSRESSAGRHLGPPLKECLPIAAVHAEVAELVQPVGVSFDDHAVYLRCGYQAADQLHAPVRFQYYVGRYPTVAAARDVVAAVLAVFDECRAEHPEARCGRDLRSGRDAEQLTVDDTSFTHVLLQVRTDVLATVGDLPGARTAWYDMAVRNGRTVCWMPSLTSVAVNRDVGRLVAVGRGEFRLLRRACGG